MHTKLFALLTTAVLGLTSAASLSAQEKDRVFLIKGVTAVGKIESITRDQVVISVKGTPQKYATNEIAKIVFDSEPSSLDNARTFITNRQYNQAETELKKIGELKDERINSDVKFYRAYVSAKMALSGMGDARKAAGELMGAHNANKDSHQAYKAAEALGDLAMTLNLPDQATNFYGELAKSPFPDMKAQAAYKLGDVALTSGKLPEARKLFDQLANLKANDAEVTRLKNLAEVGLAICDAREGKSQEALTKLNELIKKNDSTDQPLFARISNAMGVCYQALGQDDLAALAYSRTDLMFPSSPDLHAEALYQLSQLFPKIGEPQEGVAARKRLTAKYPASSWNNKK